MRILVIQSSPNTDGLTAACANAAIAGIEAAGAAAENVRLADLSLSSCRQCGNGWGGCRTKHECDGISDAFQALHQAAISAAGMALVTPVYWGDLSESLKCFTDRLRRCEASLGDQSRLAGKPALLVAAAGGGGGGIVSCLTNMERWAQHVRMRPTDLIGIKRINRDHMLVAIRAAGEALVGQSG